MPPPEIFMLAAQLFCQLCPILCFRVQAVLFYRSQKARECTGHSCGNSHTPTMWQYFYNINNIAWGQTLSGIPHFEFFPLTNHVILNSFALGFGESCSAGVRFLARIFAGTKATPFEAKVPIQVSAGAVSELWVSPVLAPQAIVCVRVLVSVEIFSTGTM